MYSRAEGPFTSPPKAAINGPKAHVQAGRRPVYVATEGGNLRAEGPLTSPSKAAFLWPKAHLIIGRRPVHVTAEGCDSRAKGPFNHGPKADVSAGRRSAH